VTACGGSKEETIDYNETPVEELYNEAQQLLSEGQYRFAAQAFNEVEKQHPYSEWATRAQLMAAYSYYEASYYDEAIASLERFISLHPGHKDIAYAYYLKGLSYYEQITDIGRDQSVTENALESLRDVAERYPETVYARDSLLKIDLTRDHLAGKDMEIGRYYMTQKHYLAALNRFKTVVKDYQTTTHVPEALHRMVECYLGLGMLREAKATGAVLGHNYPGTEWYEDTYALLVGQNLEPEASQDSWISKVWNSVL
jgi:outer membrane protein assembly factor BamD